ncbi:MAG: aldose 1-epimerase family protein [Arachnia sp.]
MSVNPTGEQYLISHGRWTAVITEVGASLRSLSAGGRELLWAFAADRAPVSSQGAQLLPWPNRIRDGRYTFEGVEQQLPLTEPVRHNALHGLNHGLPWALVERAESSLKQRATIFPQKGWDGVITVEISHRLSDDGLVVDVVAANHGAQDAPYGYGTHPYFAFDNIDEVEVTLPFDSELLVTQDRLLPVEISRVMPEHDFRSPRRLGDTEFDTALCSPVATQWTVRMAGPDHAVEVWGDPSTPWVQVFTKPDRSAIAVEPMTCGPDAFNEGPTRAGRIVLAPGESAACRWGVRG